MTNKVLAKCNCGANGEISSNYFHDWIKIKTDEYMCQDCWKTLNDLSDEFDWNISWNNDFIFLELKCGQCQEKQFSMSLSGITVEEIKNQIKKSGWIYNKVWICPYCKDDSEMTWWKYKKHVLKTFEPSQFNLEYASLGLLSEMGALSNALQFRHNWKEPPSSFYKKHIGKCLRYLALFEKICGLELGEKFNNRHYDDKILSIISMYKSEVAVISKLFSLVGEAINKIIIMGKDKNILIERNAEKLAIYYEVVIAHSVEEIACAIMGLRRILSVKLLDAMEETYC